MRLEIQRKSKVIVSFTREQHIDAACLKKMCIRDRYDYDNLRRIVKTSAKTGAEAGIPTIHNEYTYEAQPGNLVEIRHNTDGNAANDVVYSFEHDALGRQTAVKVGTQILAQSAYQNDPTKPNFGTLTATTYRCV